MSLIDEQMEDFTLIEKRRVPDGYGGLKDSWIYGATIKAVAPVDHSTEALQASIQKSTELYKIYTSRAINLQYHDVLRRDSDGKIFRVTSDGDDNRTPRSAGLNLRVVSAAEWEIPAGDEVVTDG